MKGPTVTDQPARRLRVATVSIHPVLMWDDGEELTPGPGVQPIVVPLSQVADVLAAFPAEVARLESEAQNGEDPRTDG